MENGFPKAGHPAPPTPFIIRKEVKSSLSWKAKPGVASVLPLPECNPLARVPLHRLEHIEESELTQVLSPLSSEFSVCKSWESRTVQPQQH